MRPAFHVGTPPEKPLLIYDGDCNFCTLWVRRWEHVAEGSVECRPFQDVTLTDRFPELPRKDFETAVHLVEPDGTVYRGAEAVFRTMNHSSHGSLLLEWYVNWPVFARTAEAGYALIARHRAFFSIATRVAWGRNLEPPTYQLVRSVFLRSLGLIYFVAFLSLWMQVMGLIGSNGILPANLTMFGFRQEASASHIGWQRYQLLPTLCWFSSSDGFLKAQCATGVLLSVLVLFEIAPALCLFLLWMIYLSLAGVSREFLSYQWDYLLLETGFLAVFFAPLQWLPNSNSRPPSKLVLWLLRWLLFRLMIGSGLVKLLSGDPAWKHLTALRYHYETQPLPTWVGWYAHQLPLHFQQASAFLLLVIELALPCLVFAPRRLRQIPCIGFILLQVLILLTGNYCFFNLLSILLCLTLLDDRALKGLVPRQAPAFFLAAKAWLIRKAPPTQDHQSPRLPGRYKWPIQIIFPLTCIALVIPLMQFAGLFRVRLPWPGPVLTAYNWISPFRSFNNYGLFAVMTTNRLEIVVQGSNDGVNWADYQFKYKPGVVTRRPGFVAPYQPRLDWQMWFAALSDYQHNLWFVEFCVRLLNGSPEVLGLLQDNPFPKKPPRYLRAVVYQYHFTDYKTRKRTGAWWRRERKGDYLPVLTRRIESR